MKFSSTTLFVAFAAIVSSSVVVAENTLTLFQWETSGCDYGFKSCGTLEYCERSGGGIGYRQPGNTVSEECAFPGPLIRVTPGEQYLLTLEHNVPGGDPTNIHTHGLHIGGSGNEDDITREVHFGLCLQYKWDVPSFHAGGTYWYHAHVHEFTAQQVGDGAFGMVVVEDSEDIFQGTGLSNADKQNIGAFLRNDKALVIAQVGNSWYGNNVTLAELNVKVDEWTRLRISISEPGASKKDLQITATSNGATNPCEIGGIISYDGVPRSSIPSDPVTAVTLTGASRVDLAVKCSVGEALIKFGNNVAARITASGAGDPSITPYNATGGSWNPFRPMYLEDMSLLPEDDTYSVTMTASQINGESWDAVTPLLTYPKDQVFEWTLSGTNAHPFHLHLYHMQVVTPGGCGHHEEGEWYDTISASGDCKVRFRTNDIGGRCVLHCHVLSHEDNGSMHWIDVTGFPAPSIEDPPVAEGPCGVGGPTPTPPPIDCSVFSTKNTCNAQPGCTWSNRSKTCGPA